MRTVPGNDLLTKLERLIRRAGISNIDFEGKFTAIKIHFGEPGNLAFLRPNWAKAEAEGTLIPPIITEGAARLHTKTVEEMAADKEVEFHKAAAEYYRETMKNV